MSTFFLLPYDVIYTTHYCINRYEKNEVQFFFSLQEVFYLKKS